MTHQATRNKRKGARFESALVNWLAEHGFPQAERRHLAGTNDQGDVAGIIDRDGNEWVLEAKDCGQWSLGVWWKEAVVEMGHARNASRAAVVVRRRGSSDPGDAWVVQPLSEWVKDRAEPPKFEVVSESHDTPPPLPPATKVVDLMAALEDSLTAAKAHRIFPVGERVSHLQLGINGTVTGHTKGMQVTWDDGRESTEDGHAIRTWIMSAL